MVSYCVRAIWHGHLTVILSAGVRNAQRNFCVYPVRTCHRNDVRVCQNIDQTRGAVWLFGSCRSSGDRELCVLARDNGVDRRGQPWLSRVWAWSLGVIWSPHIGATSLSAREKRAVRRGLVRGEQQSGEDRAIALDARRTSP